MKYLFFLLFITFSLNVVAQSVKSSFEQEPAYLLHTSDEYFKANTRGFRSGDNVIQVECTGFKHIQFAYTAKYSDQKHALIIRKADAQGKELAVNKLEDGDRNFGPIASESIEFGGHVLIFYFNYKDKDSMILNVSQVEPNTLKLVNTQQLLSYHQKNVGVFKLGKVLKRKTIIKKSTDGTKLLALCHGESDELLTCVLNNDMTVLRKKTSTLKDIEGLDISESVIDNAGNSVTVLADLLDAGTYFKADRPKSVLIQKANNTERLIELSTLSGGKELYNGHVQCSKTKNMIYLCGDYAGAVSRAGVWYAEIQADKFLLNNFKSTAYTPEFKKAIVESGFGGGKKDAAEPVGADLEVVELSNNNIALCGTFLLERQSLGGYSNGPNNILEHIAGPVFTIYVNNWKTPVFASVHRWQYYDEGSKPIFISYDNKIVAVYNIYERNIKEASGVAPVGKKGVDYGLVYALFNSDGKVEKQDRITPRDSKVYYYNTSDVVFLTDKKIYMPASAIDKDSNKMEAVIVSVE